MVETYLNVDDEEKRILHFTFLFPLFIPQNEIQKVVQAHCIASDKQPQKPIYLHTHNYQQHIIPDWPQIAEQD